MNIVGIYWIPGKDNTVNTLTKALPGSTSCRDVNFPRYDRKQLFLDKIIALIITENTIYYVAPIKSKLSKIGNRKKMMIS